MLDSNPFENASMADFESPTVTRRRQFMEAFKSLPWQEAYVDQAASVSYINYSMNHQVDIEIKRKTPFGHANIQTTDTVQIKLHAGGNDWSVNVPDTKGIPRGTGSVLGQFTDIIAMDETHVPYRSWLLQACEAFSRDGQDHMNPNPEVVTSLLLAAPLVYEMNMIQTGFSNGASVIASRGVHGRYSAEPRLRDFHGREVRYINLRQGNMTHRYSTGLDESLVIFSNEQHFAPAGLAQQMRQSDEEWRREYRAMQALGMSAITDKKMQILTEVIAEAVASGVRP